MWTLGCNVTTTSEGMQLDDGAVALFRGDDLVVAIAEERLTRRKHCGGIAKAAAYCLDTVGLSAGELDQVVVSNCCDSPLDTATATQWLRTQGLQVAPERVLVCPSHHMSHAATAFFPSPFTHALVIVADNEGNILGSRSSAHYERNALERSSCYVAEGGSLTLVGRLHDEAGALGFGAAFNFVTKWCGFASYHEACQVMALAGYAESSGATVGSARLFGDAGDGWRCRLAPPVGVNERASLQPDVATDTDGFASAAAEFLQAEAVRALLLRETGRLFEPVVGSTNPLNASAAAVAGWAQRELVRAMGEWITAMIERTGIRDVCLAGGVALNCVNNTALSKLAAVRNLWVSPFASDVGQSVGNCLWAIHGSQPAPIANRRPLVSVAAGRAYSAREVEAAVADLGERFSVRRTQAPERDGAQLLSEGRIIGWFQGGSEFGLRGLGQRSVLGDPRSMETKVRLDSEIKRRASFRPYAPSVLAEAVPDWFEVDRAPTPTHPLSFMLLAPAVRQGKAELIPAVIAVDGTARLQSVSAETQPVYYGLLDHFRTLTGIPLVLNTSFNPAGAPVVETPADALQAFESMNLDALILEDWVIERSAPSGR